VFKIVEQVNNFRVYLNINTKNGLPAIEIRTLTTNPTAIRAIIDAAISEKFIIVLPTFRDKLRALAALSEREIIKYNNKKGIYEYLI
jgi:hypothetical protein